MSRTFDTWVQVDKAAGIVIHDPQLRPGDEVRVTVTVPEPAHGLRTVEALRAFFAAAPRAGSGRSAAEIDRGIVEEREAWD